MNAIKLLFLAFLITISNEGPCAITTSAIKYTKFKDKSPTDERNNICCYLKAKTSSEEIKHCVEMKRVDIKSNKFKEVKNRLKLEHMVII